MTDIVPKPPKDQVLARIPWSKMIPDWTYTLKDDNGNTQTVRQTIRLEFILAKAEIDSPVTFWVSLQNSEVAPGAMTVDTNKARYWFQDKVTVKMHLARKSSSKGAADSLLDDMLLLASGPETHNGSGSVSSSVSFSFGTSFSGGFFDEVLTGNAGGSASVSESHSFSHSFEDFETSKDSTGHSTSHTYSMEMSLGGKYGDPSDLFDAHSISGILGAAFGVHSLYELPKLAKSDLPLITQAVWQANHNDDILHDAHLVIEVAQRLGACTQVGIPIGFTVVDVPVPATKMLVNQIKETIPFARLASMAKGGQF